MKEEGRDSHDVRKAEEILAESCMMIPDSKGRHIGESSIGQQHNTMSYTIIAFGYVVYQLCVSIRIYAVAPSVAASVSGLCVHCKGVAVPQLQMRPFCAHACCYTH
jgi:hypothetical protein